jgi:hypothetical protein
LCRGTGYNWSALAFRVAPLLRPPMPATAQTQTLAASAKKVRHEKENLDYFNYWTCFVDTFINDMV